MTSRSVRPFPETSTSRTVSSDVTGLTREELIKALDGHVKQATGLIGTFSKP